MKKLCSLVATVLIITMCISLPVAKAYPCPECDRDETVPGLRLVVAEGPTYTHCWNQWLQKTETCVHCIITWDMGFPYEDPVESIRHSISYQDMGCTNGTHTWKRYCTKCGYYVYQLISCPGPPHCISPA